MPRRRLAPTGRPAHEQLAAARARVRDAQRRVHSRRALGRNRFSTQPNAGVAIAVFAFLAMFGLVAGAVIMAGLDRNEQKQRASVNVDPNPQVRDLDEALAALAALGERFGEFGEKVRVNVRRAEVEGARAEVEAARAGEGAQRAAPAPPLPPLVTSGRVLLMPIDVPERYEEKIEKLASRMEELGFEVLDSPSDEETLNLRARAEKLVGVSQQTDERARKRLAEWLASDRADGLRGVVWVNSDGEVLPVWGPGTPPLPLEAPPAG